MNPKNIGSRFDDWLREEGIYEEVTANAIKRVLARLNAETEDSMSTKISLKHQYEIGVGGFHLYRECLEEDDKYVYLELDGVPFWAANTAAVYTDEGISSISFRLPIEWARKLGLVENPPKAILQHPAAKPTSAVPTLDELVEQITPENRYVEFPHKPDPDASESDLDAERDRERESQKLAAWFLAPNGWIAKPGPDGLTPIAPIDALDRLEDVINALKKRPGTSIPERCAKKSVMTLRIHAQNEVVEMVRQMLTDGASAEKCDTELRVLVGYIRALAANLLLEADRKTGQTLSELRWSPLVGADPKIDRDNLTGGTGAEV
jgi:hypothetical protein